jgi:hypothetical protein
VSRESLLAQNPLIRLMEWLILDLLGEMTAEEERLATHVVSTYKYRGPGGWREGIREMLGTTPEYDAYLKTVWERYVRDCRGQGINPDPRLFAQGYSDEWGKQEMIANDSKTDD